VIFILSRLKLVEEKFALRNLIYMFVEKIFYLYLFTIDKKIIVDNIVEKLLAIRY